MMTAWFLHKIWMGQGIVKHFYFLPNLILPSEESGKILTYSTGNPGFFFRGEPHNNISI